MKTRTSTTTRVGVPLFLILLTSCGEECGPTCVTTDDRDPLTFPVVVLPDGAVGFSYSAALSAAGGDGAYTWTVTAGSLPTGLSLDGATGTIEGTPTSDGSSAFTVLVASGDSQSQAQDLTIDVAATTVFHEISSGWDCPANTDCQDVYELDLQDGASLTVAVLDLTGSSAVRLALFGPDVPLNGPNLFMGIAEDRRCVGADEGDIATHAVSAAGRYTLAIGRDWGESSGASGTYRLQITVDRAMLPGTQRVDDEATQASGAGCPQKSLASAWDCAFDCQDVYDFEFRRGTILRIAISDVTGGSVPRLALFAPNTPLDGTNLLTFANVDRRCVGADQDDQVTLVLPASGTYRLAAGRDWGQSTGNVGTYTVSVRTSEPFTAALQTSDDGASEAAGVRCD